MKRIIALVLVVLMTASILCACGGSSKSVDLKATMDKINSDFSISGLETIDDTAKLKRYYEIPEEDVKSLAVEYASDASTYNEIILIEAVDANKATEIETQLKNHLDSKISEAKSYSPESEEMLSKCSVFKDGNYVALIINDKAEDILNTFKEALK